MICIYCIHNKKIINYYYYLQSKVQKIKQWLQLLLVHVSMTTPTILRSSLT